MKLSLMFFGIIVLSLFGCKSQQYTFEDLPENQLVFGSGGGITGASDTYVLLENGQLFHTNSLTKEVRELKSISKKEAQLCFVKLEELSLSEMDFNHPGNLYYFLEEVKNDTKHKVVWGSNDTKVSDDCLNFYKELKTHIK